MLSRVALTRRMFQPRVMKMASRSICKEVGSSLCTLTIEPTMEFPIPKKGTIQYKLLQGMGTSLPLGSYLLARFTLHTPEHSCPIYVLHLSFYDRYVG